MRHQVLEPMRRPLIVGHQVGCLQAIESSSLRVTARTSARIVAPSDHPQAIESSSPRVAAKSSGRGTSSRLAIGSSASHWVIEASSCCGRVSGIEVSSRYRSCDQLRAMDCRRVVVPLSSLNCSWLVSTPTLTSSEFLVDKPRWRIRSTITKATINFSHSRRADHLSGCIRSNAPQLHHPETTRSSCHWVLR